jgi:hypothetical protein
MVCRIPIYKFVVHDYERNPFYGLNQLPSFISPFTDDFTMRLNFENT